MQSVADLKKRAEEADLYAYSTNEDRCDNCKFYRVMREDIGYCLHRELDMVVGGPWWCKFWEPDKATEQARAKASG